MILFDSAQRPTDRVCVAEDNLEPKYLVLVQRVDIKHADVKVPLSQVLARYYFDSRWQSLFCDLSERVSCRAPVFAAKI